MVMKNYQKGREYMKKLIAMTVIITILSTISAGAIDLVTPQDSHIDDGTVFSVTTYTPIQDTKKTIYESKTPMVAFLLVATGSCAAYQMYYISKSYYPMGGEVTAIDKFKSGENYFIIIEEATGEIFTLICDKSDYDKVNAGDKINCERDQSIVTHKGKVHRINLITDD